MPWSTSCWRRAARDHLKQLQRERKHHWEAWTNLQLAEQEASTRIAAHLGGGLNWAGGLLDAYGWSGTPLAFKVPTPDPPSPAGAALDATRMVAPAPSLSADPPADGRPGAATARTAGHRRPSSPLHARRSAEPGPTRNRSRLLRCSPFTSSVSSGSASTTWRSPTGLAGGHGTVQVPGHPPPPLAGAGADDGGVLAGFAAGGARNSLNVAVHGLRRALRAAADVQVVVLEAGAYRLDAGLDLWVDVDEFERHVEDGHRLEAASSYPRRSPSMSWPPRSTRATSSLADRPAEEWPRC